MFDEIAGYDGRIAKVRGGAACGKTQAIIARTLHLLEQGCAPERILIEASTPAAANTLRRRLIAAADEELQDAAGSVRVETALALCTDVLGTPEAHTFCGRSPRVLNDAECKFLLEDLKTSGLPIRRLRKILARFYERWCHMADESTWLEPGDETTVFELLRRLLTALDAMLVEEVPLYAARYLQSEAGSAVAHAYDYVFCDDFQNLTRAEQSCMCLMANTQLIVFGNPNEVTREESRHPNPAGFEEFDARRKNVDVFELTECFIDKDVSAFADALLSAENMDASYAVSSATHEGRGVECIKWRNPEEELNGLTKLIRVRMDEGDVAPADLCVVVPNRRWARSVEAILNKRGFETSSAGVTAGLPGDPRENWEHSALAAYVRLGLIAHPDDAVLWRCWCGFGSYLTNSDKWQRLLEYAEQTQSSIPKALSLLAALPEDDLPFTGASLFAQRTREAHELIEKNRKRKGFVLLRAVGAEGIREFEDAAEKIDGDENAAQLFALVAASIAPGSPFPDNSRVLHIATYENIAGISADVIVLVATVDGLMPQRDAFEVVSTDADRSRIMTRDRKFMHSVAAKAREHLVISCFSDADLELAERTKIQVARIRFENGGRVAHVRPSIFLREAGTACPVTEGGQAKLSELGLM